MKISGYTLCDKIGEGGFSVVYTAISHFNDECSPVVCKLFKEKKEVSNEDYQNEVTILRHVHENPGVVTYYDSGDFKDMNYIILEYVKGTQLQDHVSLNLDPHLANTWLCSILDTLQYVHKKGVIHCDLTPRNILVNGEKTKIIDFGTSNFSHGQHTSAYTPGYDLYRLGLTFYRLLSNELPFRRMVTSDKQSTFTNLCNFRQDIPEVLHDTIMGMVNEQYNFVPEVLQRLK